MFTRRAFMLGGMAIGGLAVAGASGCTRTNTGAGGDGNLLEQLQKKGTITVGFAGEAPYSFEDGGELTGATVALHREIFGALGIDNVEGVNTEFGSLIPGLNANRFDAVSAGMSILPERCSQALFSNPEFMYTTALLVPKGNPEGLKDMSSFDGKDITVATMTGAIESDYVAQLGIENAMEVGTPQDGLDAVKSGRAGAFALTAISLNWMVDNNPDAGVEVTESFEAEIDGVVQVGAGGTVFRQADTSLRDAYNAELDKIVSDEARYLEIVGEFGFTAGELPKPEVTTDLLCKGDLEALQP